MTDINAIRLRHIEMAARDFRGGSEVQMHQDIGDLLFLMDDTLTTEERRRSLSGWRAMVERAALLAERAENDQAALTRLADVTVDEIAKVIAETKSATPSGAGTVWHGGSWATANQGTFRAMATAVIAFLRERVGRP